MTKKIKPYRLKVVTGRPSDLANTTYLTRDEKGHVCYMNGHETPLALSNLVGAQAAELRFQLKDALDGARAKVEVQNAFRRNHPNTEYLPLIEVLR